MGAQGDFDRPSSSLEVVPKNMSIVTYAVTRTHAAARPSFGVPLGKNQDEDKTGID